MPMLGCFRLCRIEDECGLVLWLTMLIGRGVRSSCAGVTWLSGASWRRGGRVGQQRGRIVCCE
jgi:hypothetical protein